MNTRTKFRWWAAGWIVNKLCKEHKDWRPTRRFKIADRICPGGIPDSW